MTFTVTTCDCTPLTTRVRTPTPPCLPFLPDRQLIPSFIDRQGGLVECDLYPGGYVAGITKRAQPEEYAGGRGITYQLHLLIPVCLSTAIAISADPLLPGRVAYLVCRHVCRPSKE